MPGEGTGTGPVWHGNVRYLKFERRFGRGWCVSEVWYVCGLLSLCGRREGGRHANLAVRNSVAPCWGCVRVERDVGVSVRLLGFFFLVRSEVVLVLCLHAKLIRVAGVLTSFVCRLWGERAGHLQSFFPRRCRLGGPARFRTRVFVFDRRLDRHGLSWGHQCPGLPGRA